MARGYMGKILWVDLSTGKTREEALDEELCRLYVGGYGLGAKIIFDRMPAGTDPLGPEAILGLLTGPFDGTQALGGSRYVAVGKSPLTGGWGDANSGGEFGPNLKYAGFDGVFFTGIADKPVYLLLDNGKAELKDAATIWGKDTFDTEDVLRAEYGKDAQVACIGPAGEKICLFAAIMNNKGRAAGRSGLGAVMGSKRLKAIVAKGSLKVPQFDEEKVKALRKQAQAELGGHITLLRDFGTPGIFEMLAGLGDTPTKNWSSAAVVDLPNFKDMGVNAVMERQSKKYACYRCPIGCGGHMKEGTGEYAYEAGAHKPEYETLGMFGTNCLNANLESIIKANDICNRFGVDTISAGSSIAFAIECYEEGIITSKDTDGIEMTWGNHKSIIAMLEKIVTREGFGDILANGLKIASEKIGKGAEAFAMHIQGEAGPAHSPKFGIHWALSYRLDATPARHTQGGGPFPPGLMPQYDPKMIQGRGPIHKRGASFNHMINAVGACTFVIGGYSKADYFVDFLGALTGWDWTMDKVLEAGERIANIRQAFNAREGLHSLRFNVPGRMVGKPKMGKGPLGDVTVDEETLNNEFYTAMDWDRETARPNKEKLLELGMEDVAKALWP